MNNLILPVTLESCYTDVNCNPGNDLTCGICDDELSPGLKFPQCQFPLGYKYPDKNKNCEINKRCPNDCSSHGTCRTHKSVLVPFCACYPKYYGIDCGFETPPG